MLTSQQTAWLTPPETDEDNRPGAAGSSKALAQLKNAYSSPGKKQTLISAVTIDT